MVVFNNSHIFNCDFKDITLAYFNKYPNRLNTHIKEIDCYDKEIIEDTLVIKKILRFDYSLPWFLNTLRKKFLNNDKYTYLHETIVVDRTVNTMAIEVKNLYHNDYLNIIERSEYNCINDKCKYKQQIIIDTPFDLVERFVYNILKNKSHSSIQIMEEKIKSLA
jgi:hypothetical protein